jgi:hypothetical protein
MKKIVVIMFVFCLLSTSSHAFIRDARMDYNVLGVGYGENLDVNIDSSGKFSKSSLEIEKLLDKDASFGFTSNTYTEYYSDGSFPDKVSTFVEASYNRRFYCNDYFASAWVLGLQKIAEADWTWPAPEVGLTVSIRPVQYMSIRMNFIVGGLFGLETAIGLPYNMEFGVGANYFGSGAGNPLYTANFRYLM